MMQLTFVTHPSALARWQTARVIQLLQTAHPGLTCKEYPVTPTGHRLPDHTLPEPGGKDCLTRELEDALLSGNARAAVHSLKDLPVEATPGLEMAAIPERESAHDVLVSAQGWTFSHLPQGARVGTSSLRRTAQLLARRPDLNILPLRGSVDTRVRKLLDNEYDAVVLAQAGLTRLGLQAHISEIFSLDVMLPAPGQGALAVQCRADDSEAIELLSAIHDSRTADAIAAERAFLSGLVGACSLPIAAYAEKNGETIVLTGAVMSADGRQDIRLSAANREPQPLGERLAALILERGAAELLKPGMRVERA